MLIGFGIISGGKIVYSRFVLSGHSYQLSDNCVIRPRKKQFLPDHLTIYEVGATLSVTENIKHKLLLSIIYGAGLRRSEAKNLLMENIDIKRSRILIKDAKGGKDWYSLLPGQVKILCKIILEHLNLLYQLKL